MEGYDSIVERYRVGEGVDKSCEEEADPRETEGGLEGGCKLVRFGECYEEGGGYGLDVERDSDLA